MTSTHDQEKKQFKRLFQQQGIGSFDLRFQVLEAFLAMEHHVTVREIHERLKEQGVNVDLSFVSDSMDLLCRFGFANRIELDHQDSRYEHRHIGLHHDHMVCTKCGSILEFKDEAIEKLQIKVANAYGFHMLQHKMEIYGICSGCMAERSTLVPLHKARQGEHLVIREFEAGKNMQMRMNAMGLRLGDKIEVVSSGFGGQVVVAVNENRLVLGKGMAEKIIVKPYSKSDGSVLKKDRQIESPVVQLSRMKPGQEGVIRKVTGESLLRRRLLEMGINRGSTVYVAKYAPLKDPLELVVKGYHLSLRVEEAANIFVENVKDRKR